MKNYNYKGRRNLIGQNVRAARMRMTPPMTQEKLALEMGKRGCPTDRFIIMHIESGKRFVADFEVKILSEVLGLSLEELFREEA